MSTAVNVPERNGLTVEVGETGQYAPGSMGCHELLDRALMLAEMTDRYVVAHPACAARPEWLALAERAAAALHDLYQQVGAVHLADEEPRG